MLLEAVYEYSRCVRLLLNKLATRLASKSARQADLCVRATVHTGAVLRWTQPSPQFMRASLRVAAHVRVVRAFVEAAGAPSGCVER